MMLANCMAHSASKNTRAVSMLFWGLRSFFDGTRRIKHEPPYRCATDTPVQWAVGATSLRPPLQMILCPRACA
eukprot:scaffold50_cov420-Prasinococcus_capsulatus_cf.AAC.8